MKDQKSLTLHQNNQSLSELTGIAKLFAVLSANYGKMWFDQWQGTPLRVMEEVWKKALAGYSAEEIEAGVAACAKKKWPPNLPEFLLLCRPEIDAKAAWAIASRGMMDRSRGEPGQWKTPVIYWAAVRFGAWELINESFEKNKVAWQSTIDQALADQVAGKLPDIPEPMLAIVAPGHSVTEKEVAKRKIREILQRTMELSTGNQNASEENHQGGLRKVF